MNAALRKALAAAQLTETDVAAHLGVDPKTVRRWLSGQRPYPRHRWALADLLQINADALWPQGSQEPEIHDPVSEYVQRFYAHRWQVPRQVWYDLFSQAEQEIGILVYSGLFLADDAGILDLLAGRSRDGVKVRILLGDPESEAIIQRGKDESIGSSISARASNALMLFKTNLNSKGIEIRTHSTVLYNSIYITEKKIIVNHHIYGLPAAKAPAVEIDRPGAGDIAKTYVHSFELAWNGASPCSP